MPGLLGDSMDDPRTAGVMALAAGLLHGDYGSGLAGYGQAYQGAQTGLLQRQMLTEELALKRLAEQRAQQQFRMQQDAYYGTDTGNPAPSASPQPAPQQPPSMGGGMPGAPAIGAAPQSFPQAMASQQPQPGMPQPQSPIDAQLSRIGRMAIAGVPGAKEQLEILRYRNDPQKMDAGAYYRNPVTGQSQFLVDPKVGLGVDDTGAIVKARGSSNIADLAGEAATAQETAKAKLDPLPLAFAGRDGRPLGGSRFGYLNPPTAPTQSPAIPAGNGTSITPDLAALIASDAKANGIASPMLNFQPPTGMRTATFGLQSGAQTPQRGPVQLQSPAEAEAAKVTASKAAESGQAYKDSLDGKVEEEFQLVNRNKQIAPLLDKFKTGGFAPEERLHLGNAIANSGMLPDGMKQQLGNWIASGDTSSGKVIENQLASAGILNMLQTLDKEGKPNRAIFQAVQKAQEGLNSGNTTLKDVFELQNRLYQIHFNEQQALTKSIKDGSYDPRTWAGDYSALRNADLSNPAVPLPSSGGAKVDYKWIDGKLVKQ